MLDGVPEFFGQLTVRDKHKSDHSLVAPVMACFIGRTLIARPIGGPGGKSAILSTRSRR